jgi:hypothetical protein
VIDSSARQMLDDIFLYFLVSDKKKNNDIQMQGMLGDQEPTLRRMTNP